MKTVNKIRTARLQDTKVDVKVLLGGLWISMLFVFAYGMQELRLGECAFTAGGKPTLAWAQTFDEAPGAMAGYVLATAFDEVWLQPGGDVGMLGVVVQTTFVRGALDRLGIEPQLDQRHEFKNAADQIMRTEFTRAHRIALDRLAESVFTDAIAQGRGLDRAAVRVDGVTGHLKSRRV